MKVLLQHPLSQDIVEVIERPEPERWEWEQQVHSDRRWTLDEIDQLKDELNRRHLLDPLWTVCADALGSLSYDLIDARRGLNQR